MPMFMFGEGPDSEGPEFHYYQLAECIAATLAYARTSIQNWIPIRSNRSRQVEMKLAC